MQLLDVGIMEKLGTLVQPEGPSNAIGDLWIEGTLYICPKSKCVVVNSMSTQEQGQRPGWTRTTA